MSTHDPNRGSEDPEDLVAETESLLGEEATQPLEPTTEADRTGAGDERSGRGHDRAGAGIPTTGSGMSAGMWASLILGAVVVVLLLIFILQNNVPADFSYFGWRFQLPLGVAMLFAAIGGILIAGIIGSVRIFVLSRRLRKISKALGR